MRESKRFNKAWGDAMPAFVREAGGLELCTPQEVLRVEPWGPDAVRV